MTANKTAQKFRDEIALQLTNRPWLGNFEPQTWRYGMELLNKIGKETDLQSVRSFSEFETICLAGAPDWNRYSYGGCSVVSEYEIAFRFLPDLCGDETPKPPHGAPDWMAVQAKVLPMACRRLWYAIRKAQEVFMPPFDESPYFA